MSGFDLIDEREGIFASLHAGRAAVLFEREDVVVAGPAGPDAGSLVLDGVALDVELTPAGDPLRLAGELTGAEELTVCRASGKLTSGKDGDLAIEGLGVRVETETESPGGLLRRSLAIVFPDGELLALIAARPEGAGGHDAEEVVGAMTTAEGPMAITEVLLSTEYDDSRRPRRATLELQPEGGGQIRGAGTMAATASVESADGTRIDTALFRWSVDGRPGLGRYEIIRAR